MSDGKQKFLPLGFNCKHLKTDYIPKINAKTSEMCLKCIGKVMNPHPNYSGTRYVKHVNELRSQQFRGMNEFLWNLDLAARLFRCCQDSVCTATQVAHFYAARNKWRLKFLKKWLQYSGYSGLTQSDTWCITAEMVKTQTIIETNGELDESSVTDWSMHWVTAAINTWLCDRRAGDIVARSLNVYTSSAIVTAWYRFSVWRWSCTSLTSINRT